MATNIYYDSKNPGLLITSNFGEIQRWMDVGVNPHIDYKEINISEVKNYKIIDIGFDKVDNDYFQSVKDELSKHKFEGIAFHETTADLSDVVFDVEHLVIRNCMIGGYFLSSLSLLHWSKNDRSSKIRTHIR